MSKTIEEIVNELEGLRLVLERKRDRERTGTGVWQTSNDRVIAINEAIAKLREYQALQSSDTSARLAAIKDTPTERVIALAQAEAAGLVSISPSAAEGTHPDNHPNGPQGDGWISVDDKDNPPPEAKKVIVWLKLSDGNICDMAYYMGEDGWYYEGWDAPHHGVVTHWLPLPEPPEEEQV